MSNKTIVIDVQSNFVMAGFAGSDKPMTALPAVLGKRKQKGVFVEMGHNDAYVGKEAMSKGKILTLKYPIQRGLTVDWDGLEKLLHHALYNELRCTPERHRLLITEFPLCPSEDREKLAQLLLDRLGLPSICIARNAVLALAASGRTTGVVLHIEGGVTHAVPVHKGLAIPDAIVRSELGTNDLTEYLATLLTDSGYSFTTTADRVIAQDILEKLGRVALDLEKELKDAVAYSYELPSGEAINVGSNRFRVTEALFTPSLIEREFPGVHRAVYDAILKSDVALREAMFSNVVLAGEGTLFDGLADRMVKELKALAPASTNVQVIAPPERSFLAWLGGSRRASEGISNDFWITKLGYESFGAEFLHKRTL